jgi:predicted Zn-dependent protease
MSCTTQLAVYQNNTTKANNCWSDSGCAAHYACHEIGHTTGLQHPDSLDNPDTCMGYANSDPDYLRQHDMDHLTNCYPHPTPPLPTFPAETRTSACANP